MKFVHTISRGSKFNQIYVPKKMENDFEVGDLVEVKLIKKNLEIYYHNLKESEISDFKKKLIEMIFNELQYTGGIKQIFIFGSFLTSISEYNDIDIMLLTEKDKDKLDEIVYYNLTKKFNLKFHIISVSESKLKETLKICPLTRSMLYYYVSNGNFKIPKETIINKKHIQFLLMFPQDLLKTGLSEGKVYYDVLRKLICIEHFLKNDEIAPDKIDRVLESILEKNKVAFLKENGSVQNVLRKEIEKVIKNKIDLIYIIINHGKER